MNRLGDCGDFVILGANGSIGAELARLLRADGAELTLLGRDQAAVSALAVQLGARWSLLPAVDPGSVRDALLAACRDRKVAGVANCIGSLWLKPANRTTVAEWDEVIAVNLGSAFGVAMAAPQLLPDGGSVVFVSSVAARVGLANHEAIAAAKAGVEGLARASAATHARRGIRFHCVAPALVHTRMTSALLSRPGTAEACAKQNPLGRIGQPQDVARAIAFLLDPANSWIDAEVLAVDGGFGSVRGSA